MSRGFAALAAAPAGKALMHFVVAGGARDADTVAMRRIHIRRPLATIMDNRQAVNDGR
jgi:hypothetical protein